MSSSDPITAAIHKVEAALQQAKNPDEIVMLTDRLLALLEQRGGKIERLWNLDDVAKLTGFNREHVRRLTYEKRIPHVVIGSRKLFEPRVIKAWIRSKSVGVHKAWRK